MLVDLKAMAASVATKLRLVHNFNRLARGEAFHSRIILPVFGRMRDGRRLEDRRRRGYDGLGADAQPVSKREEPFVIKAAETRANMRTILPITQEEEFNVATKVTRFGQQPLDQHPVQRVMGLEENVPSTPVLRTWPPGAGSAREIIQLRHCHCPSPLLLPRLKVLPEWDPGRSFQPDSIPTAHR